MANNISLANSLPQNQQVVVPQQYQPFTPLEKMVMALKAGGQTLNTMFNPANKIAAAGDMSLAFMGNPNRQDDNLTRGVAELVAGNNQPQLQIRR